MEDSPCQQEMVELAAMGSPEERNRLRDFTNIMLEHDIGSPSSPDDVQDDETAAAASAAAALKAFALRLLSTRYRLLSVPIG